MVMSVGGALMALSRGAKLGVCGAGVVRLLQPAEVRRAADALRALRRGRRGPLQAVKRCRCKLCSQRRQRSFHRRAQKRAQRHKCHCTRLGPPASVAPKSLTSRGVQTDTESVTSLAPRRPVGIQTDADSVTLGPPHRIEKPRPGTARVRRDTEPAILTRPCSKNLAPSPSPEPASGSESGSEQGAVLVARKGGALELVVSESEVRLAGAALAAAGATDGARWARDPTYRRRALYRLQPLVRLPRAPLAVPSRAPSAVKPLVVFPKPPPAARPGAPPGRAYSALEDQSIVAWLSACESRERAVNGNRIWRELQHEHTGLTGVSRSWHSLRNRYLRYLLPSLGSLALDPQHAQRLRAAAATGELKARSSVPRSRRASILSAPPVRSASARQRPKPHTKRSRASRHQSESSDDFLAYSGHRRSRPLSRSPSASPSRTRSKSLGPRDRRSPRKGQVPRGGSPPRYSELTARYALRRSTSSVNTFTPPQANPPKGRSRRLYNPLA